MKHIIIVAAFSLTQISNVQAQGLSPVQEESKKLLERVIGTKVSYDDPTLVQVMTAVSRGDRLAAVDEAMRHPDFYNVTVKKMASRMSTRSEDLNAPLNDFSAFFIGVTRDGRDARELLTGNYHYRFDRALLGPTTQAVLQSNKDFIPQFLHIDFILKNNLHYSVVDRDPRADLARALVYVPGQPVVSGQVEDPADATKKIETTMTLPAQDAAGVLSSRQWITEHATAGTNRRPIEFAFREFLCTPIGEWSDAQASDARIGQDITRFPGDEHTMFQTSCKGCHTGMDGFRGAYAYFDGNNRVNHSSFGYGGSFQNRVKSRMNIDGDRNSTVVRRTQGYYTTDNSWVNYARGPGNANLFGWRGSNINGGVGLNSLGVLISNSERFSQCMVKRVYEAVCRNELSLNTQLPYAKRLASRFEQSGYNLKSLFSLVVTSPECGG